tara:strand:+ start:1293 stop:1553 length:261 start_codon:yes stop_codon:yes gene_type:complete
MKSSEKTAVTSTQGRTLKAELVAILGQSVSVRKRGKYSFSVDALGMSDSEIREALNASQCTIVKTVSGLFGTAGIWANELEYVVTL